MTTSLSKSTIPEYNPNDNYTEPRMGPRVKFEGRENFEKNRGTLNIGDWAQQGKKWESPRPTLKLKYEEALNAYKKNTEGCMKELLGGYCANPPLAKTGPRIPKEAWENYRKNRGSFSQIIGREYGTESPALVQPRVKREGSQYEERQRRGEMGSLLGNYGNQAAAANEAAHPIPRVKFGGENNLAHNRGSSMEKALKQVPLTNRPSSSQFFNHKYY